MATLYQHEKNKLLELAKYYEDRAERCLVNAGQPGSNKKMFLWQQKQELEKAAVLRRAAEMITKTNKKRCQMKIKLSTEEKELIIPIFNDLDIARASFREASRMIMEIEKALWAEVRRINKGAINVSHPDDGDWEITVKEGG